MDYALFPEAVRSEFEIPEKEKIISTYDGLFCTGSKDLSFPF